jgi:hypothetical protein
MTAKLNLSDSPESKSLLVRYHALGAALGHRLHDPIIQAPTGPGSRSLHKGKVEAFVPASFGLTRATIRDTADEALEALVEVLAEDLRGRIRQMRCEAADLVARAEELGRKADAAEKVLRGEP